MVGTRKQLEVALIEKVDMPLNMVKTSSGYAYRKLIPADVRHIINKSEFKKSLGKDYLLAKSKCAKLEAQVTKMIDDARQMMAGQNSIDSYLKRSPGTRLNTIKANTAGLSEQVSSLYLAGLDVDLELRRTRARDSDEFDQLSDNIKDMLPRLNRAIATGDVDAFFPVVSQLLLGRGYMLDGTQEEMQTLTYDVLVSIQAGYRALAERQEGNLVKPTVPPTVEVLPAAWEPIADAKRKTLKQAPKLSDVIPLLSNHFSTTVTKNKNAKVSFWQRFIAFCGDKPLANVSVGEVFNFLESRLKDDVDPWASSTMLKAKSLIRDGFSLAQTKGLCDKNPVLELIINPKISKKEESKRKKKRVPFESVHLNQLFSSDWYNPGSNNWHGKMRGDLAARYWVPLICLYHGLRITEALQLFKSDIVLGEPAMLRIAVDENEEEQSGDLKRTLKNEATQRVVPIHPKLIELGLLDYVKHCSAWKETNVLFPSSIPDDESKSPVLGRSYSQAFLRFLKQELNFPSGYCNHSFRHSLEDCLRDIQLVQQWPAGLGQLYSGRRMPRDADRAFFREQGSEVHYGRGYDPSKMVDYVSRIDYENVVLPPKFKEWLGGVLPVSQHLRISVSRAKHNPR